MSRMLSLVLVACYAWACVSSPHFLESAPDDSTGRVERAAFLDQLEEFLGPGRRKTTESRLATMQAILQSTFVAMPKTANGRLSQAGARYAMHRLFVQYHGWFVKGVAPTGGPWQPSLPAMGMGVGLPAHLRDLLEERFGGEDLSLDELALLAATIEALIHSEAAGRLHATYKVLETSPQVSLSKDEAGEMIYSCLTVYLFGFNISQLSREELEDSRVSVEKDHPNWLTTRDLIRDSQKQFAAELEEYAFEDVERVFEIVNENMGRRVDEGACQEMEDELVKLADNVDSGRVRLADFYTSYLEGGTSQFRERPEFLRQQGALDESDPSVPRVIIPNYLTMVSNCHNVSTYYNLCCNDLCEVLLLTLEVDIKAPQASPEQIMKVLGATDSGYVQAGRNWTAGLVKKLEEVAEHHGGEVPLHGRLFGQWLHLAYPYECPYPHLSGATQPATGSEWLEATGSSFVATREEMLSVINGTQKALGPSLCADSEKGVCMWAPEEELVDAVNWRSSLLLRAPIVQQSLRASALSWLHLCALLAVLASSAVAMRNVAKRLWVALNASLFNIHSAFKARLKGEEFTI